jgi:hypothetical protein
MIERYIGHRITTNCSIRKRNNKCYHQVMRSYRREKNLIYVKDSVYCEAKRGKTLVSIENIKVITPFEFWNSGVVSYGGIDAFL